MTARGLVIAAPRSGSGKTTLTLGLLRAFARDGLRVSGLKCGPDYIDPAFHLAATGRPSRNLDSWAMTPDQLCALASEAARDADLVICEGLMGLFDGVPGERGRTGSTADVAATLGWPVVLVHDVSGQSQSAAAQMAGCAGFDPRIRVAGVVLNRVGSERHRRLVGDALAGVGLPVLGALPRQAAIAMPERHLGLVQAEEMPDLLPRLDALASLVDAHVDRAAIQALAAPGPASVGSPAVLPPPGRCIAVARDAAFSFLYPHVVEGWRARGATLRFFSPLADEAPPEACDSCWLPGGYPELHAGRLAGAAQFLEGLRRFADTRPVHGECGGYMVLGEALVDGDGAAHRMAGLLGHTTSFAQRRMHLGYRDARLCADGPLGAAGTRLRGHEFHYATVTVAGPDEPFAVVADAYGSSPVPAGSRRGLVSGSFFHAVAAVS